jgi:hypothetical protein
VVEFVVGLDLGMFFRVLLVVGEELELFVRLMLLLARRAVADAAFDKAVLLRRSIERAFRSGATHREVLAVVTSSSDTAARQCRLGAALPSSIREASAKSFPVRQLCGTLGYAELAVRRGAVAWRQRFRRQEVVLPPHAGSSAELAKHTIDTTKPLLGSVVYPPMACQVCTCPQINTDVPQIISNSGFYLR